MLLVHDNQAGLFEGYEHRRSRPQYDGSRPLTRCSPGAVTLRIAHARVQRDHGCGKPGLKARLCLRCQCNLGQQHQSLTALRQAGCNTLQVDLGFAAAGHAVKQVHAELTDLRYHRIDSGLLLGIGGEGPVTGLPARVLAQLAAFSELVVEQCFDDRFAEAAFRQCGEGLWPGAQGRDQFGLFRRTMWRALR